MRNVACALAIALTLAASTVRADDAVIVQPAVRDVSPPGVMPIPAGPLVREPVPPLPPEPPRWRRYFLPLTPAVATFVVPGITIHVSGVAPPLPAETCATGEGGYWPCGTTALFALRRFLHGRAIECYFQHDDDAREVTAPCRVGRRDIGLWLLQNGWARANDRSTDTYRDAARTAACEARGLWHGLPVPADCTGPAKS